VIAVPSNLDELYVGEDTAVGRVDGIGVETVEKMDLGRGIDLTLTFSAGAHYTR
jgi:hypothetical protein